MISQYDITFHKLEDELTQWINSSNTHEGLFTTETV